MVPENVTSLSRYIMNLIKLKLSAFASLGNVLIEGGGGVTKNVIL